jgi:hypothetical protein
MIKPYLFNNVDWYTIFGNEKGKILEEGMLFFMILLIAVKVTPKKNGIFLATFHTYGPFLELLIFSCSFWARLE